MFSAVLFLTLCLWPLEAGEQPEFLGKTVDAWRRVVRSKAATPAERRDAVWALGCFGDDARLAAPDLIEMVHRGDLKDEAISALNAMGVNRELAVPGLIATFVKEGCQHHTAMGAIGFNPGTEDALVGIGGPAVPALVGILEGPNRDMRVCAAAALGRIGPTAHPAIPALIQAATSPEKDYLAQILKYHAVIALGKIGPEARAIVPTVRRWLEGNQEGEVGWPGPEKSDLVTALNRIGFPPVSMLVDEIQQGKDPGVAMELAGLGSNAREAIPVLRNALSDKRRNVRVSAAIALAGIQPTTVEAVPALTEALDDQENEFIRDFLGDRSPGEARPRSPHGIAQTHCPARQGTRPRPVQNSRAN
jgi:HEAT repeat protein